MGRLGPRGTSWLLLSAVSIAVVLAQAPALGSFFMDDDFLHLFQMANEGYLRFVFTPYAEHVYLLRNAIFALLRALFGLKVELYLAVVVATHLVNVALLFRLLERLFASAWIAALGALLWGASPAWREVLGWYSAHGIVLVSTFLLLLLLELTRPLEDADPPLGRWLLLLIASTFCYGGAVAIALILPALFWLLCPDGDRRRALIGRVASMSILVLALYFVLMWGLTTLFPEARAGQAPSLTATSLPFALDWGWSLLSYGLTSLVLGPFGVVEQAARLQPVEAPLVYLRIAAWSLVAVLLAWALRSARRDERSRLLAFALIPLGFYALIVLGRTQVAVLLGLPPDAMAMTARYHYSASIGIVLALFWLASHLSKRAGDPRLIPIAGLALWLLLFLPNTLTGVRATPIAERWRATYEAAIGRIDRQIRRSPASADVYIRNQPVDDGQRRVWFMGTFPGTVGLFILTYPENEVAGRRVYFVDDDTERVARSRERVGTRLAEVLISPDECDVCPQPGEGRR